MEYMQALALEEAKDRICEELQKPEYAAFVPRDYVDDRFISDVVDYIAGASRPLVVRKVIQQVFMQVPSWRQYKQLTLVADMCLCLDVPIDVDQTVQVQMRLGELEKVHEMTPRAVHAR